MLKSQPGCSIVAHQKQELTDKNLTEQELKIGIEALHMTGK
jgi:type III restriction enzyme